MTRLKHVVIGLFLVLALLGGSISSRAQGESALLASLTAQWWQYATSIPASVNPLTSTIETDPTGDDCKVGQRDPIWFLAGAFSQPTVRRKCTVPAGEWMFFPVINNFWTNTPNVCGQAGSLSVAQMRSLVAPLIDSATNLSVKVDGKNVNGLVRVKSDVFATTFPVDNIFNAPCVLAGLGTVPAGVYSKSVDDGYYLLLKPLSTGSHALRIQAESSGGFQLDVRYDLTVCGYVKPFCK